MHNAPLIVWPFDDKGPIACRIPERFFCLSAEEPRSRVGRPPRNVAPVTAAGSDALLRCADDELRNSSDGRDRAVVLCVAVPAAIVFLSAVIHITAHSAGRDDSDCDPTGYSGVRREQGDGRSI